MVDDVAERYRISELEDYTEAELFDILKTAWGYSKAQPFDVIGRLNKISLYVRMDPGKEVVSAMKNVEPIPFR